MFSFRKITLEDRDAVNERLAASDLRGCEYSFANNNAWQRLSGLEICLTGDFYICRCFNDGVMSFIFPAGARTDGEGREKYLSLFSELKKYSEGQGQPLVISSVRESDLEWLKEYYGDRLSVSLNRDDSDYIYRAEDLIELKGKKYHGKRNHIRHFVSQPWSFEPISKDNLEPCILFAAELYNKEKDYYGSAAIEQFAIDFFLMNMDRLDLKGGVMRSCGRVVGFSIGEKLNSDTFVVHIEKADSSVQGAYPMLMNQFAAAYAGSCTYINREEDMGIEGLRKSKESYHPAFMLDKYTVTIK